MMKHLVLFLLLLSPLYAAKKSVKAKPVQPAASAPAEKPAKNPVEPPPPLASKAPERKPLEPYGVPPKIELTAEQKAELEKGDLVFWEKSEDLPKSQYFRGGTAAFRVNASPNKVWKVISDFSKYPDWAYKVAATKDYKPAHDHRQYIEFKAEIVGKKYYVEHEFLEKEGYLTWKTDPSQKSECVLNTVGFWRVEPVKDHPNTSTVYYSGEVILNRTCAKGFLGIGGFSGPDMARQTFDKIKKRV